MLQTTVKSSYNMISKLFASKNVRTLHTSNSTDADRDYIMNTMSQLVQTSKLLTFKYGGNIEVDDGHFNVTWTLPWVDVPQTDLQEIKDTINHIFRSEIYKIQWHEWTQLHPLTNAPIAIHTVVISIDVTQLEKTSYYSKYNKPQKAKVINFHKQKKPSH